MPEPTLLALALAVNDAHRSLSRQVRDSSEAARFLVDEVEKRLDLLVTQIREREGQLDSIHEAVADRINNLMMSIRTASDLLRVSPDDETSRTLRSRLERTIETGREAVKRLRDAIRDLR